MLKGFILDDIFKKGISIFYRITLLLYGVVILFYNVNTLHWYYYLCTALLFITISIAFYDKPGWKSKVRLLSDFILISIFLFEKPMNPTNYCFLLLPLLNSPNHTGNKRSSILLYIITCSLFLFFRQWSFYSLVPLLVLISIDLIEQARTRFLRFGAFLNESLDEYYFENFNLHESHILYKQVIKKLNTSKFKNLFTIRGIACFIKKENRLIAVNGSFFIWTYDIQLSEADNEVLKTEILQDKEIVINGNISSRNFIAQVNTKGLQYVYVINYMKKGFLFFLSYYYVRVVLYSLLCKIAETLYIEREIMIAQGTNIKKIKDKILYVNNATLAMHFLRNKFSPITGFFETQELLDKETDPQKKEVLNEFLIKNKVKVKRSISDILNRANQILEKTENPLVISSLNKVTLQHIFLTANRIWCEYFDSNSIKFSWTNTKPSKDFQLNSDYLEILITDIVKNVHSHNNGFFQLIFIETDNEYSIIFKNDTQPGTNLGEMKKLCSDFMSDNAEEINKRTSHGLSLIKSFLKQMNINHDLTFDGTIFSLEISLKKV